MNSNKHAAGLKLPLCSHRTRSFDYVRLTAGSDHYEFWSESNHTYRGRWSIVTWFFSITGCVRGYFFSVPKENPPPEFSTSFLAPLSICLAWKSARTHRVGQSGQLNRPFNHYSTPLPPASKVLASSSERFAHPIDWRCTRCFIYYSASSGRWNAVVWTVTPFGRRAIDPVLLTSARGASTSGIEQYGLFVSNTSFYDRSLICNQHDNFIRYFGRTSSNVHRSFFIFL